jgi:peptidyl-prolyl cis-trans isomerase SurA
LSAVNIFKNETLGRAIPAHFLILPAFFEDFIQKRFCGLAPRHSKRIKNTMLHLPLMLRNLIAAVCLTLLCTGSALAQDPVLFTVNGNPVLASEFKYIYAKTNQEKADFSEKSLREYLDLYTNFKLKVQKARDMQLDTAGTFKSELEGYRRQLANSYLIDREVTDRLVREAWERMQQDVDISQIFVTCDRARPAEDTLRAYNRTLNWIKMIQKGANFNQIAVDSSDDKTVKENKGDLGFVSAMLPDGYYAMEKAIYAAQPGALLGPIRSNTGYHVVRVNGFRPARGEMEVGQILIRKGDTPEKTAAQIARRDSAYAALSAGGKWEEVCQHFTDDKTAAARGGYLGFFGINRYQKTFEDAAFALEKDGDFSKPVETTIGWHIIRRISRRPIGSFENSKKGLIERVKRDSRSETAKQSMVSRIKKEGNFQEYPPALNAWVNRQADSIFHTFKWKPDPAKPQDVLMRYGQDKIFTVADFEDYCARAGRERMRGMGIPIQETVSKLYKSWSDETAMAFEESQLDKKYPDFKALMREYEEGILLFEALKQNVWDKANTDSAGLETYFKTNLSQKYKWEERAQVSIYTLKTDDPKILAKVRQAALKKPAADVVKKFNKKGKPEVLTVMEKPYERGKNKELGPRWAAGEMTDAKVDAGTKTASFLKIEAISPPTPKSLAEARGYAVADYQDYLEKQWINSLREQYPVKLNEDALRSMVKK